MVEARDITVFIDPSTHHWDDDQLFHPTPAQNRDDCLAPFLHLAEALRARGIAVHTADRLAANRDVNRVNVYFSMGNIRRYEALSKRPDTVLSAFVTLEAPIICPSTFRELPRVSRRFNRIFSFTTPEAVADFGCAGLEFQRFRFPQAYDRVFDDLWRREDRGFLIMINVNKLPRLRWNELYTERLRAMAYFAENAEIDLYGVNWDSMPYITGETWIPATLTRARRAIWRNLPLVKLYRYEDVARKVYKGPVDSKYQALARYRFAVCYENLILPGWVTEKMIDCLLAGTVPIYWGAPDITDYVPEDCFIDRRRFETYDDLLAFLRSVSDREVRRYKENARDYLASELYRPFTKEAFAGLFLRSIEEDVGIRLLGDGAPARDRCAL